MTDDPFAQRIFASCGVQRRHLKLLEEHVGQTLQGRSAASEAQMFELAVAAVDRLGVDPRELDTIVSASLYSLGGPTLASQCATGRRLLFQSPHRAHTPAHQRHRHCRALTQARPPAAVSARPTPSHALGTDRGAGHAQGEPASRAHEPAVRPSHGDPASLGRPAVGHGPTASATGMQHRCSDSLLPGKVEGSERECTCETESTSLWVPKTASKLSTWSFVGAGRPS